MRPALSANTRAILLLTEPLLVGRKAVSPELMSPSEYERLARHLRDLQHQPADLLAADAAQLVRACRAVIEESRLQSLLGRGFLLSQAVERWQTRAIWVASSADADYPRRLKTRLQGDAPALLYGCGEMSLLETGGLAVIGSRNADDMAIADARSVGRLAANAGKTLISGGARGTDQAAMLGALEEGGRAIGVLADSLEKSAMNREHRNALINDQLVLISPYDPGVSFDVGNAMRRNKLIYALADVALVVSCGVNKGGTWAGATEQLDKLRMVPVYVRSAGESSAGFDALRRRGAIAWPNPQDVHAFKALFDVAMPGTPSAMQAGLSLFPNDPPPISDTDLTPAAAYASRSSETSLGSAAGFREEPHLPKPGDSQGTVAPRPEGGRENGRENGQENGDRSVSADISRATISPADALFASVRDMLRRLMTTPMKAVEVAAVLEVSTAQAKSWLQRLVDEGVLEEKKPAGYVIRQSRLFE
ncbi:Predicted Rossmann fold nucleotide-binding protein DprA/Smf involved in DNA uptake [Rhizobiales bacterium GAS113]|nr:Predicted Rossmann fold nucleotide-binding protein DprA/Smf involved in DNA uptake [Rhizobiales bacterium GAS113]